MVIDDFNIEGIPLTKDKTEPPLIIYPNAPLTKAFSTQCFKPVAGR